MRTNRKLLQNSKQCVCVTPISLAEQKAYAFQKYPRNKAPYFCHTGFTKKTSVIPPDQAQHTSIISGNKGSAFSMQNVVYNVQCQPHLPAKSTLQTGCILWRGHLLRYIHLTDNVPALQPLTRTLVIV